MENLNIDYKFSIEYDTDSNDRPVRWTRYGEEWSASTKWEENNAVTAMFYRMLEDRAEIDQLRAELEQERELADRMYGALEYIIGAVEMTQQDNVGAAFPCPVDVLGRDMNPGMSLRDWFAGQALAGINANPTWDKNGWSDRARASYEAADAMLAARRVE